MEYIKLIVIGLVLGITTIIPGVSTGTMAVVFNVYERLVNIITPNIKKILSAWKFWFPLALGVVFGVIFFSKVISFLLAEYPLPCYWFFIGIISGSVPLIYRKVRQSNSALPSFPQIICAVLGFAVMVVMALLKPAETAAVYADLTLPVFMILAAAGALAAVAMILPGISGSFLLLVIGLYRTIIQAVSDLNIPLLIPVVLGICAGLFIGAALVRFLLAKAFRETYGAVLGLVAGSVLVLYPGGLGNGIGIVISIVSMLIGFAISYITGREKSSR